MNIKGFHTPGWYYGLAVMFGPVATTRMSKQMLRLSLCCEQEGGW